MQIENVTAEYIVEVLARNPLVRFNKYDWEFFAGAEDPDARIAYEENLAIILDGNLIQVIDMDSEYADFVDFDFEDIYRLADC